MERTDYRVYVRRHFVLMSFAFTMAAWNLSGLRYTAIVPSYAFYHNITNEVSVPPVYGVDMFSIISSIVLLFSYLPCSYAIDKWGLRSMIAGSFVIALSSWFWFLSGKNALLVILSKGLAALFGPLIAGSLLAISNRWYPPHERAKATAIGSLFTTIGGALALVIAPQFATQKEQVVELALKSCKPKGLSSDIVKAFQIAKSAGDQLICTKEFVQARESFCCYLPVDIPKLNLTMAIVCTAAFIFTAISVRDLPPTPPAPSGAKKDFVGIWKGLKILFGNQRFAKLALSDFLVSGPPLVVFATIARIFPAVISDLSFISSAIGIGLAIPASVIAAHYLDKTKAFWTFTMSGYAIGTVFWLISTICFAIGTRGGAYVFLVMTTLALTSFVCWQTAVYETKVEYVFSPTTPLEGVIMASDRIILNLSSLIFLVAIPPERVGSAQNTFYIGLAIMIIGCIPTALIIDRFKYVRLTYDSESTANNSNLDETSVEES